MLSRHSDRCPLWWKCPESHCARHIHQKHVCKPYVLNIRWTRTWKHMASNCVVVFLFPSVCVLNIDVNFQLPTWRLAITSCTCQPITHLLLFIREDTPKKCWLSISCRTATLDFFSIWLNLKSQCFCALSWPVMESPFVLGKTRFLDNPTI